MRKSMFSEDYDRFLSLLRDAREEIGMTQQELAERLDTDQSTISKCERGERRIDVIELRRWCQALGTKFQPFIARLDRTLGRGSG
ncbi:MAG: helix-turn-helix transcriptional regulator [Phycisphaerales bacterium]|nr:helix-turn-helix transcriptional regulator [Phycisphaerales bacterium]